MNAAPVLSFAPMSVHIGEEIERRRVATRMSKTALAEKAGVDRTNIYQIILRPSMDTAQLKLFCRALNFNFFALLSAELEEEAGHTKNELADAPAVYGRRPAEHRAPLRLVIEVDPGDDEAQERAIRMARQLQAPALVRDKDKP